MILDKLLRVSEAQLLTVTAASTDVLDMLAARDMGIGDAYEHLQFIVTVLVALTSGGATTLQIQLQGSVDNVTWSTLVQTEAIPKANLTAGMQIPIPMPMVSVNPVAAALGKPRYYRLNYVVATGPFTGGSVQADLVPVAQQQNLGYAPGFAVPN